MHYYQWEFSAASDKTKLYGFNKKEMNWFDETLDSAQKDLDAQVVSLRISLKNIFFSFDVDNF